MYVHMTLVGLFLAKSFVAHRALVWHFTVVRVFSQHVTFEVNSFDFHSAESALLKVVIFVDVLLKMHFAFEFPTALLACHLFLHVVVFHVVQVVSLGPLPTTDVADCKGKNTCF